MTKLQMPLKLARARTSAQALAAGLSAVLFVGGCATLDQRISTLTLRATGDEGVTFRVISNSPDGYDRVVAVPATLTFTGRSFEVKCIRGAKPGRLKLEVIRGGLSIAGGDTTEPGQVTHFRVRGDTIAASTMSVGK